MSGCLGAAFAEAFDPYSLRLMLMPTERCNFRCTYCYESFDHGRMAESTIRGIRALVERRSDLQRLNIMWFGGEPTAALDIVMSLSSFFLVVAQRRAITYTGHMTTNGYKLEFSTFERLVELGVTDYQVTLDGPQQHHDSTRKLANRRGSYERIIENLSAIRRSDIFCTIILRVHLSKSNAGSMPEFVNYLDREFLCDERFSLNLHPIENLGGAQSDTSQVLDYEEQTSLLATLTSLLTHRRERMFEYNCGTYVCYAAKPNSFVIRANGTVAKCTVALYRDVNNIGWIDETGELHIDQERHRLWLTGWPDGNRQKLACPAGHM